METKLRVIYCPTDEKCGISRDVPEVTIQEIIGFYFSKVHYLTSVLTNHSVVEIALIGERNDDLCSAEDHTRSVNSCIKYWCGDTFYGDVLMVAVKKVPCEEEEVVPKGLSARAFCDPSPSYRFIPVSIKNDDMYYFLNQMRIVNEFFV